MFASSVEVESDIVRLAVRSPPPERMPPALIEMPDEAKPGFTKLIVTAPLAALTEIADPDATEVTPVFWNWMLPLELAMPMPVEVVKVKGAVKVKPAAAMVAVAGALVI